MRTLLITLSLLAATPVFAAESAAFNSYLIRERDMHLRGLETRPGLRKQTMALLSASLLNIDQAPRDPLELDRWEIRAPLPKRQASSEVWIAASEGKYEEQKRVLRGRYDQLRKETKPGSEDLLFASFSLAQAIVASEYREKFSQLYRTYYPELDMSAFEQASKGE